MTRLRIERRAPGRGERAAAKRMGIAPDERRNVGAFFEGQRRYLEFHREAVFLESRVGRE